MLSSLAILLTISLSGPATAQAAPSVVIDTATGPRAAAPLLAIEPGFTIKLGGPAPATIAGRDLVALRRVGIAHPDLCAAPFVLLSSGDRLPLATPLDLRLEDEVLHATLAAPLAGKIKLPQAAVAAVAFTAAEDDLGKRTNDVVVLRDGDRMHGALARLDARGVLLTTDDKRTDIPIARISRVAFNPEYIARPRPAGIYAEAILAGGARVSFRSLTTTGPGGQLAGELLLGNKVSLGPDDVLSLRIRNGAAVYLDDLKPSAYESTPFLDLAWPLAVGRTLRGGPLRFGKDTYPLGLAMHSRSRATYALGGSAVNGGYGAFEATVGVDAAAGPRGSAAIDILVDGKPAPDIARVIHAGDPPALLRVDLKDAKTLTLVTDFGPRGDVQSHVLWTDARLLKK